MWSRPTLPAPIRAHVACDNRAPQLTGRRSTYEFNRDFHVSFTADELQRGQMFHNYRMERFPREEAAGISVFCTDGAGAVFHTYSCYSRGLDMLNVAYHYLDLVPKGRDEDDLPFTQAWVRHHDKYDD